MTAIRSRFSPRRKALLVAMLALADDTALRRGRRGLSLIVSDANAGARRLYERRGYRAVATRPMVKEGWVNEGQNWVLMTKPGRAAPTP